MKIDPGIEPEKTRSADLFNLHFILKWICQHHCWALTSKKKMNSKFGLVLSFSLSPDLLNWPLHHWKTCHGKPLSRINEAKFSHGSNPFTSTIWLEILLSRCYTFPWSLGKRIWVTIETKPSGWCEETIHDNHFWEFSGRVKLNSSYIRYSPELSFALEEKLVLSCIVYGLLKEKIKKKQVKTVKKVSCAT